MLLCPKCAQGCHLLTRESSPHHAELLYPGDVTLVSQALISILSHVILNACQYSNSPAVSCLHIFIAARYLIRVHARYTVGEGIHLLQHPAYRGRTCAACHSYSDAPMWMSTVMLHDTWCM